MNRKDPLASIPVPDWVLDPITAYGDARATVDGPHDLAALELADTITALRRWAVEVRAEASVPRDRELLRGAYHALMSYGMGNSASALGRELAYTIERHLGGIAAPEGTEAFVKVLASLEPNDLAQCVAEFALRVVRFGETSDASMFSAPRGDLPAMEPGLMNVQFLMRGGYGSAEGFFDVVRVIQALGGAVLPTEFPKLLAERKDRSDA